MTVAGRPTRDPGRQGAEVLADIAAGDIDALRAAYDRHATLAWSLALRLVGDRACAEDVVEAAFLRLWRTSSKAAGAGSVRSRVIVLVTREARARGRQPAGRSPGDRLSASPAIRRDHQLRSR